MRSWKTYLLASAAIGCWGVSEQANAQIVYAGGATFPAPVYRQLFDCHSVPVDGNPAGPSWSFNPGGAFIGAYPISPACGSATGDVSGLFMQVLYAPVGSGAGKRALIAHDGSSTGTGLGAVASSTIPFVSSFQQTYGYPTLQFVGSDDPWTAADAANYTASGNAAHFGAVVQLPSLAGAVVIAFNANAGSGTPLNINNPVPAGATADKTTYGYPGNYSGLNLTRKAVCGIFTGHITAWNDPELTAANGGVALGTGQITVVHRTDGSGTNFLFTNALYRQCQGISGPINTADALSGTPHLRSWEFHYSDANGSSACIGGTDVFYRASNLIAWPGTNDACGTAVAVPSGAAFVGASGNGAVKAAVEGNNGYIGYSTTDYSQPVLATGMQVANVQSQFDVDNPTNAFQWPSPARITNAMAAATPIFPNAAARANPLNWSSQAQVPNPGTPDSYPIVGFTWLDLYQCYDNARSGSGTFDNLFNYLGFHYYDSQALAILNGDGFASIPATWRGEMLPMLTGGPSQLGDTTNSGNTYCYGKQGA